MTESGFTAQDALCDQILVAGIEDFVSMADVQGLIDYYELADGALERQQLVVGSIDSLLSRNLIQVGVIPGPDDPGFGAWAGNVDEIMQRLVTQFVDHHDEEDYWAYKIWLNLTDEGRAIAAEIFGSASENSNG